MQPEFLRGMVGLGSAESSRGCEGEVGGVRSPLDGFAGGTMRLLCCFEWFNCWTSVVVGVNTSSFDVSVANVEEAAEFLGFIEGVGMSKILSVEEISHVAAASIVTDR